MATVILRISASILLLTVLPGRAQTPVKDTRSASISHARMRSLLRGMAFDFTEDSTGDATAFAIHLDGHLVSLLNQVKGLGLSACFEGGVDPMKENQWNREHFSTRAYVNEKGCASLGADVSFGGGPTDQMIQDFVLEFCTDVAVFAKLLANSPAGPTRPRPLRRPGLPAAGSFRVADRRHGVVTIGPSHEAHAAVAGGYRVRSRAFEDRSQCLLEI